MYLDVVGEAGAGERALKIFERRRLAAEARIRARRRGVWVHGDDPAEAIVGRDGGEADRGFALEAADLEDDAWRWCARRGQSEKAGFAFGEEAGRRAHEPPGFIRGGGEVRRERTQPQ